MTAAVPLPSCFLVIAPPVLLFRRLSCFLPALSALDPKGGEKSRNTLVKKWLRPEKRLI